MHMCIHTSQAGLTLAFGRLLLCALGERVADDLVFALLDRNITALSVQITYINMKWDFTKDSLWAILRYFYQKCVLALHSVSQSVSQSIF